MIIPDEHPRASDISRDQLRRSLPHQSIQKILGNEIVAYRQMDRDFLPPVRIFLIEEDNGVDALRFRFRATTPPQDCRNKIRAEFDEILVSVALPQEPFSSPAMAEVALSASTGTERERRITLLR